MQCHRRPESVSPSYSVSYLTSSGNPAGGPESRPFESATSATNAAQYSPSWLMLTSARDTPSASHSLRATPEMRICGPGKLLAVLPSSATGSCAYSNGLDLALASVGASSISGNATRQRPLTALKNASLAAHLEPTNESNAASPSLPRDFSNRILSISLGAKARARNRSPYLSKRRTTRGAWHMSTPTPISACILS